MAPSRRYSCFRLTGRCRGNRLFSTTFSISLYANPPQKPLSQALIRIPVRKVPTKVLFPRHLLFGGGGTEVEEALGEMHAGYEQVLFAGDA